MLVAIPAVIFAGVSKGGFGSGAAFAATPILSLAIDPKLAIGILLPLLMLIDVVTVGSFWRRWHLPSTKALIWGSLPGVALAAVLYRVADADMFRILIGTIALGFVMFQIAREQGWLKFQKRPFRRQTGWIAGAVGGFTSFISHAGGPPVAVFLLSQELSKTQYQATTAIVFWVINVLKFVPYAFLGIFSVHTLWLDLWLAPFAVLGALLGVKAHHLVPERPFFLLTYTMLVITGLKLLWDAFT